MVVESNVIGWKCLIDRGKSLECDEQDACTQCGFLHCHHFAMHENRARAKGIQAFSISAMGRGWNQIQSLFVGCWCKCQCSSTWAWKVLHEQIIEIGCLLDVFMGSHLVDVYLRCWSIEDTTQCSTWCPDMVKAIGTLCLEGMPHLGMVRKLLNILNRGIMDIWTSVLSLFYYLAFSIWKDLLFMELPMKRKLSVDFACRQKVAIIGHFRWSFLKEADFAHKGSWLKDWWWMIT